MFSPQEISPWSIYDNFSHKQDGKSNRDKYKKDGVQSINKEQKGNKSKLSPKNITELKDQINKQRGMLEDFINKLAILKLVKHQLFETRGLNNPLSLPLPSIHSKSNELSVHRSRSMDEYQAKVKGGIKRKIKKQSNFNRVQSHQLYTLQQDTNFDNFSSIFGGSPAHNPQKQKKENHNMPQFPKLNNNNSLLVPQLQSPNRNEFGDQKLNEAIQSSKKLLEVVNNFHSKSRKRGKLSTLVYDYPV